MRIVLHQDHRVGVLTDDGASVVDVTRAVPGWDTDPLSDFWTRLCRDFDEVRPAIEEEAARGQRTPLHRARLAAPVLNPGKVVAVAMNYADHCREMEQRPDRSGLAWRMDFDVFLKAPTSVIGPNEPIALPVTEAEIHHECELGFVIGTGGRHIPTARALDHVLGYTIVIDVTLRGPGDRSRRKSYDTFTPTGPWLVTREEVPDPQALSIALDVDDEPRQRVDTEDMLVGVADIIAYASNVMTLRPGDLVCTGAPPGVGPIVPGNRMAASITGIGSMQVDVTTDPDTRAVPASTEHVGTP